MSEVDKVAEKLDEIIDKGQLFSLRKEIAFWHIKELEKAFQEGYNEGFSDGEKEGFYDGKIEGLKGEQ